MIKDNSIRVTIKPGFMYAASTYSFNTSSVCPTYTTIHKCKTPGQNKGIKLFHQISEPLGRVKRLIENLVFVLVVRLGRQHNSKCFLYGSIAERLQGVDWRKSEIYLTVPELMSHASLRG